VLDCSTKHLGYYTYCIFRRDGHVRSSTADNFGQRLSSISRQRFTAKILRVRR